VHELSPAGASGRRGGRSSAVRPDDRSLDPAPAWRSYGTDPLPTGAGALDEPFARSRRGITCDRCGKDRMLNETHTPQGGMHRAGWILLTGIVAGTCGTTATARAAKIYGNWVESADNTECVLFTVPQDSGPIIMLRARNKIKVISVAAKSGHDLQAGRLIITVDQRQVVTLDLIGRGEPMALLPFELSEAMRDGRVIDIEWSEKGHEPVTASYPISRDGFDAWDACAKWQSEAR
jgi:hypothetical protein